MTKPRHSITPGAGRSSATAPYLWPLIMTASASSATASFLNDLVTNWLDVADRDGNSPEPQWSTANTIALELSTMRLRDFSNGAQGQSTLICAPYALHGATIADFAPDHSLVETLHRAGLSRVFVTDWRSATPDMRFFSIDNYLADLNVAVDELKPPIDLIGLCQGGWLGLVYAARYPEKVRRLVLAGAPIDFHASESHLSRTVANIPLSVFDDLVRLGEGRVLGRHVLDAWAPALDAAEADLVLQVSPELDPDSLHDLEARFRDWYAWTVDLPGPYYLQTVNHLYRENQIAKRQFVALGRCIDLRDVRSPVFLLAARDDDLVAVEQLFAAANLVGSPKGTIEITIEPCGHLSLFLGARTLAGSWTRIAHWLSDSHSIAMAS